MDNQLLQLLVREIGLQCRYSLFAYNNLQRTFTTHSIEETFFFVHAFLSHGANVSKLMGPSRPASSARGKLLRRELGVADRSPIELRSFRNHLEHYDERLEDWASSSQRRNIADMNVMPRTAISGVDEGDFHRNLNPQTKEFYFRGEGYDLPVVAQELENVANAAQIWLKNHAPQGNPMT